MDDTEKLRLICELLRAQTVELAGLVDRLEEREERRDEQLEKRA